MGILGACFDKLFRELSRTGEHHLMAAVHFEQLACPEPRRHARVKVARRQGLILTAVEETLRNIERIEPLEVQTVTVDLVGLRPEPLPDRPGLGFPCVLHEAIPPDLPGNEHAIVRTGRRQTHLPRRSQTGVGRARIGSPIRKRCKSSARAAAVV